ncbi:hypothetical protein T10_5653 [Trichinella papuae]|uniref:Uncharacterized protein n=1 Tax=Trichinella papuae TaxID=268474 RepID=A0A0V1MBZ8_9BILA|nr:hypothetical protein T10_5653 [Trichinella papuae]
MSYSLKHWQACIHALLPNKSRGTYDHMAKEIMPETFLTFVYRALIHKTYKNDTDFALQVKMVIALAFVPTDGLEQAIDNLAGHLPDEIQPLHDCFEDSYVGHRNRRGGVTRPPIARLSMETVKPTAIRRVLIAP